MARSTLRCASKLEGCAGALKGQPVLALARGWGTGSTPGSRRCSADAVGSVNRKSRSAPERWTPCCAGGQLCALEKPLVCSRWPPPLLACAELRTHSGPPLAAQSLQAVLRQQRALQPCALICPMQKWGIKGLANPQPDSMAHTCSQSGCQIWYPQPRELYLSRLLQKAEPVSFKKM